MSVYVLYMRIDVRAHVRIPLSVPTSVCRVLYPQPYQCPYCVSSASVRFRIRIRIQIISVYCVRVRICIHVLQQYSYLYAAFEPRAFRIQYTYPYQGMCICPHHIFICASISVRNVIRIHTDMLYPTSSSVTVTTAEHKCCIQIRTTALRNPDTELWYGILIRDTEYNIRNADTEGCCCLLMWNTYTTYRCGMRVQIPSAAY